MADPAYEDVVLVRGFKWSWEGVVRAVVDDHQALCVVEGGADLRFGGGASQRDGDGLCVGAKDRNANAGGRDGKSGGVPDFARFGDHFGFFAIEPGGEVDLGVVAEDVEGAGFGEDARGGFAAIKDDAGLVAQLVHCCGASSRDGLIG